MQLTASAAVAVCCLLIAADTAGDNLEKLVKTDAAVGGTRKEGRRSALTQTADTIVGTIRRVCSLVCVSVLLYTWQHD